MTSTGSNRVVVSRGRDLEKIEQLEDENADHLEKIEQLEDENWDHLEKIEQLEDENTDLEEKIEQLEEENADLRGALYTVKKKLRRTRLIFLQYDRLLAGGTIESDSDSDYSDSEY